MRVVDFDIQVNDSAYVLLRIKSASMSADYVIHPDDAKKLGNALIVKANYPAAKRDLANHDQLAGKTA